MVLSECGVLVCVRDMPTAGGSQASTMLATDCG